MVLFDWKSCRGASCSTVLGIRVSVSLLYELCREVMLYVMCLVSIASAGACAVEPRSRKRFGRQVPPVPIYTLESVLNRNR